MNNICKQSETGCCKRFDPEPWDQKEIFFQDKLFLKDHVRSIFHIPLNYGQVMVRCMKKIKKADALISDPVMLSDESSLWGTDVYIAISKDIPGEKIVKLSGTFLSKVFEGSFNNMGKWVKEMKNFVLSRDKNLGKMYFFYTTCPKCAKFYGKNYIVILVKI